jgi:PKD repeat protein
LRDQTSFRVRALAIAAALAVPAAGAVSVALTVRASAQVAPATVSFTGHDVSAIEGHGKDFHVATVSGETLSDISVDWGDASATSSGAVNGEHVHATHTYAEAGTYTITVTADATVIPTGPQGAQGPPGDVGLDSTPVTATATATITEATVNLHGEKTQVLPGGAFDATVADGTDHNDAGSLSDFSAVIDWGDGGATETCTACIVDNGDGSFDVDAKHQYAAAGVYDVQTMVQDGGGDVRHNPVTTTVIVPIVAGAISGAEGTQFSGTVGSVITPRNLDVVGPAVAVPGINAVSIDWGDGSGSSDGTVGADGTVTASHTYSDEGTYTITLTGSNVVVPEISKKDTTYSGTNTVTIADAPLTGSPSDSSPFTATAGTVLTGVFGSVVDGNSGGPASDLSATIDWGDGSSSAATLSQGTSSAVARKVVGSAGYNATGSHTYTTSGVKNGVVHFVDKGGATADVPFTVNVAASQVQGITSSPNPTGGTPAAGTPVVSTPNTGADLPITTAALLVAAGGSLFAVGRRRRS